MDDQTALIEAQQECLVIGLMKLLELRDSARAALKEAEDGLAEFAAMGPDQRNSLAEAERRWAEERALQDDSPSGEVVEFRR